jgi:hypothetical protein
MTTKTVNVHEASIGMIAHRSLHVVEYARSKAFYARALDPPGEQR